MTEGRTYVSRRRVQSNEDLIRRAAREGKAWTCAHDPGADCLTPATCQGHGCGFAPRGSEPLPPVLSERRPGAARAAIPA